MSGWLPTPEQAKQMTDQAVEQSGQGVSEEWRNLAEYYIEEAIYSGKPFSANDIWAAGLDFPDNKRALGDVLRSYRARGLIKPTGDKETSRWGHGQEISVWIKA